MLAIFKCLKMATVKMELFLMALETELALGPASIYLVSYFHYHFSLSLSLP